MYKKVLPLLCLRTFEFNESVRRVVFAFFLFKNSLGIKN